MCNNKELYLRMRNGEKESELTIPAFNGDNQLAIIQGVFSFFDVDVNFKEMAEIDIRTRQAYASFYKQGETEFTEIGEDVKLSEPQVKFTQKVNGVEVQEQHEEKREVLDHHTLGYKIKNGEKMYRCRYTCQSCGHRTNIYIKESERWISCYSCNKNLKVLPATTQPFPARDSFGNFFIAGANVQEEKEELVHVSS